MLAELHKNYKDLGLIVISMSNEDASKVKPHVQSHKDMIYPVGVDSGAVTSKAYGVRGIPHAFLISPDNTVIWEGHPAQMDLPDIVQNAALSLGIFIDKEKEKEISPKVESALKNATKRKFSSAATTCKKIIEDQNSTEKDKTDAQFVLDKIEERAKAELSLAESYSAKKWFYEAEEILKKIEKDFSGLEVAKTASEKIATIEKEDGAKDEIKAGKLFEKAKKAIAENNGPAAKEILQEIVKKYPNTETAKRAQDLLGKLR